MIHVAAEATGVRDASLPASALTETPIMRAAGPIVHLSVARKMLGFANCTLHGRSRGHHSEDRTMEEGKCSAGSPRFWLRMWWAIAA
jgi:hypothetical protein